MAVDLTESHEHDRTYLPELARFIAHEYEMEAEEITPAKRGFFSGKRGDSKPLMGSTS